VANSAYRGCIVLAIENITDIMSNKYIRNNPINKITMRRFLFNFIPHNRKIGKKMTTDACKNGDIAKQINALNILLLK
jgi:hypothetical protein